jgi:acyl-coenzyme A synthetase/AMP-(fatty) acid ligase
LSPPTSTYWCAGQVAYRWGWLSARLPQPTELTAEKFIPHPFREELGLEPSARLYKSGDLARYLPDGNIEFLGRLDYQVKIRGYRLELGEIEAVLSQQSGVHDTVVIAREDVPGAKRLVAYVVPDQAQSPAPAELRRHLQEKLPDYMVPAAFVFCRHCHSRPMAR